MAKFYAIVVIYNKKLADCPIIKQLRECGFSKVVICDNSVDDRNVDAATLLDKAVVTYIKMDGNEGISKAYRRGFSECLDADYICFFDDDTELPLAYLEEIESELAYEADIFLPIVTCNKLIVSPCNVSRYSFAPMRSIDELQMPFSAINSGMCVRRSYYELYPHGTNLFIDFVDHEFMRDAFLRSARVHVVERAVIHQKLSLYENVSLDSAIHRQRLFEKDCAKYYRNYRFGRAYSTALIVKRRIQLGLKSIKAARNGSEGSNDNDNK